VVAVGVDEEGHVAAEIAFGVADGAFFVHGVRRCENNVSIKKNSRQCGGRRRADTIREGYSGYMVQEDVLTNVVRPVEVGCSTHDGELLVLK
jgi:hypothetical protein